MDREAWWATVHKVSKSPKRLSNFIYLSVSSLLASGPSSAPAHKLVGTNTGALQPNSQLGRDSAPLTCRLLFSDGVLSDSL